jgi:hypothetical protein
MNENTTDDDEEYEPDPPNLECDSCGYQAFSSCLGERGFYCKPAVCRKCNNIYDINTEFCGNPEEVNACHSCGAHNYKEWDQEKAKCPKCDGKMLHTWPSDTRE